MRSSSSKPTARRRLPRASNNWARSSITTSWAPSLNASNACAPSPAAWPANWAATYRPPTGPPCWPRPTWVRTWWANSPSCKASWARTTPPATVSPPASSKRCAPSTATATTHRSPKTR
ncbi:hypothetical protein G6F65_022612 [Rhizopus arrhizus]|nr:hypothetical protein G6F65_022612 [Rhizopus arrhizus]